jgi:hypothetical protein
MEAATAGRSRHRRTRVAHLRACRLRTRRSGQRTAQSGVPARSGDVRQLDGRDHVPDGRCRGGNTSHVGRLRCWQPLVLRLPCARDDAQSGRARDHGRGARHAHLAAGGDQDHGVAGLAGLVALGLHDGAALAALAAGPGSRARLPRVPARSTVLPITPPTTAPITPRATDSRLLPTRGAGHAADHAAGGGADAGLRCRRR